VAEQPRDRELDEGGRLWVGVRRRGELDPGSQLADLVAVPQPAVADDEDLVTRGLEIGDEMSRIRHRVVPLAEYPAGRGEIPRVEHLAAPRVDRRHDRPRRVTDRERERVEAREPDDRHREDLGEGL